MIAFALSSIALLAQVPSERESRWRVDIGVFAHGFSGHQLDFAKLYPERPETRPLGHKALIRIAEERTKNGLAPDSDVSVLYFHHKR